MKIDMSAKAISTRLKRVAQLRRLGLSLAKSKPLSQAPRRDRSRSSKKA